MVVPVESIEEFLAKLLYANNLTTQHLLREFTNKEPWDYASQELRDSAMNSARWLLSVDDPKPWDLHDEWVRFKTAQGWRRRNERDYVENRTTPSLCPYSQLPDEGKFKAHCSVALAKEVKAWVSDNGGALPKDA